MRFNPPPNWPPVPPGWVPDAGWSPDPSWPAPPPGWQLWIEEATPAGFPEQSGPLAAPPGAPMPPGAPGPRRRRWILPVAIGTAVTAVAGLAVGAGLYVSASRKPAGPPDITTISSDLLVSRAQFPDSAGGKWLSGLNDPNREKPKTGDITIDPPECAHLYGDPAAATQSATATLSRLVPPALISTKVELSITPGQRSVPGYQSQCETFTESAQRGGRTLTTTSKLERLSADGIPSWASGTVLTTVSSGVKRPGSVVVTTIGGYYRGVLVTASNAEIRLPSKQPAPAGDSAAQLVNLFNTQVAKLTEAP